MPIEAIWVLSAIFAQEKKLIMSRQQKILVVDDEATLCEVLKINLELEGYAVDTACCAEEALALDLSVYDLLLLDVMMGDISGIAMARIIKKNAALADIPIIFCTARDTDTDMIEGLETGADDYVTKPYNIRNLMLRVRSVLRRSAGHPTEADRSSAPALSFEGLAIDTEAKHCTVDGMPVKLPRKEFEILCLLLANPGKIFTREEILGRIWPEAIVVLPRVVDVNITRLRSKIGHYGKHIVTRSGYGYGFEE